MAARVACELVDPARNARLSLTFPEGPRPTLGDALQAYRRAAQRLPAGADRDVDCWRFADGLFLLSDGGTLGDLIPGLRFLQGGRECGLDLPLGGHAVEPPRIVVDRTRTGYTRHWPAWLTRRWNLRADGYAGFVASAVERACGGEADAVLRRDTPDRVFRFIAAVARAVHDAPYETYSRYLEPATPFRSADQALDRIISGDGGNCAEKALAFYLLAHGSGVPAELVLGGEEASGKFPYRALRSVLDGRTFDEEATRDAQRHWQHYAVLCRPPGGDGDAVFCDVAGSNIPPLVLTAREAAAYLDPVERQPLHVVITLEPIRLFYHRLDGRQDVPLDLAYAMEHFIEGVDVIHTVDNELGLLHAGDLWLGAVAHRGRRDLAQARAGHERFVARAGLDPRVDLAFMPDLAASTHPLLDRLRAAQPRAAARAAEADAGLRRRVRDRYPGAEVCYVIMRLRSHKSMSAIPITS